MKQKTAYLQPMSAVAPLNAAARLLAGSGDAPLYNNRPTAGFMSNPDVGESDE